MACAPWRARARYSTSRKGWRWSITACSLSQPWGGASRKSSWSRRRPISSAGVQPSCVTTGAEPDSQFRRPCASVSQYQSADRSASACQRRSDWPSTSSTPLASASKADGAPSRSSRRPCTAPCQSPLPRCCEIACIDARRRRRCRHRPATTRPSASSSVAAAAASVVDSACRRVSRRWRAACATVSLACTSACSWSSPGRSGQGGRAAQRAWNSSSSGSAVPLAAAEACSCASACARASRARRWRARCSGSGVSGGVAAWPALDQPSVAAAARSAPASASRRGSGTRSSSTRASVAAHTPISSRLIQRACATRRRLSSKGNAGACAPGMSMCASKECPNAFRRPAVP